MSDVANNRRAVLLEHLEGSGIEIGALNRPVPAPHLEVTYVDRLDEKDIERHYPEIGGRGLAPLQVQDDAETLGAFADASQDFVIANHVIEHMADPIGALLAWQRVLRVGGRLFMAVPDKHETFDRTRPITTIEHLLLDHEQPSAERDFEAFHEFALEVSAKTFQACAIEEAEDLARQMQREGYSIHYHVWDDPAFAAFLAALPDYLGDRWRMNTIDYQSTFADEFIYVLEKRA